MRTVLISGAGVAGATLAYWLGRHGFRTTVVEQSQGVRSSGNPVDVRDAALPITESMGVLDNLRQYATRATDVAVLDATGRRIAAMPGGPNSDKPTSGAAGLGEVELLRSDLARVLLDACSDAELIFDDSITELSEDENGVDVALTSGQQLRFDLVIGADGVHSATRRMIFGPEQQFVTHLGMYVGTVPVDLEVADGDAVQLYNAPGRLAALHPARGQTGAAFIFRHPQLPDGELRDAQRQKKLIMDSYAGDGWILPQLLERVRDTEDLYFDAVSRIDLPSWSRGRVGLVGDAASSVSLLGDGSTKAIIGAHILAEELSRSNDHRIAFRRYQERHQPSISSPRQVRLSAAVMVPATAPGLAVRNAALRVVDRVLRLRRRRATA